MAGAVTANVTSTTWLCGQTNNYISMKRRAVFYFENTSLPVRASYTRAKTWGERERGNVIKEQESFADGISPADRRGGVEEAEEEGSRIKDNDKLRSQLLKLLLWRASRRTSRTKRTEFPGNFFHLDSERGAIENLRKRINLSASVRVKDAGRFRKLAKR